MPSLLHRCLQAEGANEGEAALLAAAHTALHHVVTAAVEHRSLVGLRHALELLGRALIGLPGE